eukprot:646539-Karenia_brevis.AAC.1
MEQIRYAQEVAGRIASREHRMHLACEDTQDLAPGQILCMSACAASSDGQPPYMPKGLSLFQGDSSEETPQTSGNQRFQESFTLF